MSGQHHALASVPPGRNPLSKKLEGEGAVKADPEGLEKRKSISLNGSRNPHRPSSRFLIILLIMLYWPVNSFSNNLKL